MKRFGKTAEIIYEDGAVLVLHKPSGMASETRRIGEEDAVSFVKKHIGGVNPYAALINRLDQPVEGVLLFAKEKSAAEKLNRELQSGKMEKEYLALVKAENEETLGSGEWQGLTDYLKRLPGANLSAVTTENDKDGKKAELKYRVEEKRDDGTALLRIQLLTGRHHQIRLQLSHAGLPIVGDRKYGYVPDNKDSGLCLAAVSLSFRDPVSGKVCKYSISLTF